LRTIAGEEALVLRGLLNYLFQALAVTFADFFDLGEVPISGTRVLSSSVKLNDGGCSLLDPLRMKVS